MSAYYNEIDPQAAAWLDELIKQGLIADGVVDRRSIEDVVPSELTEFTQCHFFAGIGVWSWALRMAGWPDDRPVWTGSCPCQPFSSNGKRKGFDDERHLWPSFFWLIRLCRPDVCFGEQVASPDGRAWLDLVSSDLENEGYACGATSTVACGFGAPEKRQRLYWVACPDSEVEECLRVSRGSDKGTEPDACRRDSKSTCASASGELVCSCSNGLSQSRKHVSKAKSHGPLGTGSNSKAARASNPLNSFWRDPDWISCTDGYFRPVEPGTFPLADGAPERVGRVRGHGNALVAQQAEGFITAYLNLL